MAKRYALHSMPRLSFRGLIHPLQGKEGIVIVKTNQALLMGHHPENVQTGNAANVVELLADYLIKVGY